MFLRDVIILHSLLSGAWLAVIPGAQKFKDELLFETLTSFKLINICRNF